MGLSAAAAAGVGRNGAGGGGRERLGRGMESSSGMGDGKNWEGISSWQECTDPVAVPGVCLYSLAGMTGKWGRRCEGSRSLGAEGWGLMGIRSALVSTLARSVCPMGAGLHR